MPTRSATAGTAHTTAALLALIDIEFDKLLAAFAGLADAQMTQPGAIGAWSVKDVLAHLTAWEKRLLQRVAGKPEDGDGLGTPQFNGAIYLENKDRALSAVVSDFQRTHKRVVKLAHTLDDAQAAQWWQAFKFNTFNHYKWASVNLRRWRKTSE